MKAFIEAGITWIKDKLYQKAVDVVMETAKKAVDESVVNKIEPVKDEVVKSIMDFEEAREKVTKVAETLGIGNHDADAPVTVPVQEKEPAFVTEEKLTEDTKAIFDVKLFDTIENVEYDRQVIATHHISQGKQGKFVEIENITERARSKRNHRSERNLANDKDAELAQAIKTYYELSGIEVREIFHLHNPKTTVQSTN